MPDDRRLEFRLNGVGVTVDDSGASLLEVLREQLGVRSVKDGCSPQGQCGCCTVLVDGAPRVACVTPARRVANRDVTTLEGFAAAEKREGAGRFTPAGASQCGFCTPGIIVRLAALKDRSAPAVEQALLAHLCRCTGWRTIVEAAGGQTPGPADRDWEAAGRRATIEGGVPQAVGPHIALGGGGFADDTAPRDALVAVPDGQGGWAVGETMTEARQRAGKVQGRHSGTQATYPIDVP